MPTFLLPRSLLIALVSFILSIDFGEPSKAANADLPQKTLSFSSFRLVKTIYQQIGYIGIQTSFNGIRGECMLDTGSMTSSIISVSPFDTYPAHAAKSVGLSGQIELRGIIQIPSVSIATGWTQSWLEVSRLAVHPGHGAPCTIGSNYFARQRVQFNFKKNRLILQNPVFSLSNTYPLHLYRGSIPRVQATLGGETLSAWFDTGIAGSGIVDLSYVRANPELFIRTGQTEVIYDSKNIPVSVEIFQIKTFVIGSLSIHDLAIKVHDLSAFTDETGTRTVLMLGLDTIRRFNWMLDFAQLRWSVDTLARDPSAVAGPIRVR